MRIAESVFDPRIADWPPYGQRNTDLCLVGDCGNNVAGWRGLQQCFCARHLRPLLDRPGWMMSVATPKEYWELRHELERMIENLESR